MNYGSKTPSLPALRGLDHTFCSPHTQMAQDMSPTVSVVNQSSGEVHSGY